MQSIETHLTANPEEQRVLLIPALLQVWCGKQHPSLCGRFEFLFAAAVYCAAISSLPPACSRAGTSNPGMHTVHITHQEARQE